MKPMEETEIWTEGLAVLRRQAMIFISRHMVKEMIQRPEAEAFRDIMDDVVRLHISWQVAAKKATNPLMVPSSWWQHFKRDHFPAWALKRWPVKYDEHWAHQTLPALKLPEPELGGAFHDWLPGDRRIS